MKMIQEDPDLDLQIIATNMHLSPEFGLTFREIENDGFIINAMHSREGCYTYIKEIINGNSVIMLADEEREALDMALENTYEQGK